MKKQLTTNSRIQLDFHLYKSSVAILLLSIFLFITGNYLVQDNYIKPSVKLFEYVQSLLLLFMAWYTYRYACRVKKTPDLYKFWIWTIFWWLLMFGRGISWGRDFFPEVPRFYYKIIGAILIALPVLMMFTPVIRKEIARRFKTEKIPVWHTLLAFVFLGLSDVAEHHRPGYRYLVVSPIRQDLVEELMELPCFLCLALVTLYLQKNEQQGLKSLPRDH